MKSIKLEELKWPDVKNYLKRDNRIIIPVGSVEQHGEWLPMGTDAYAAISLAEDASAKTKVIMTPPIWFGWCPEHMALPGTITIRPEVEIELLYDVIESLTKHGFKKFVLIDGHRIVNMIWMQIVAERAQRKLCIKVVIFEPSHMSKELKGVSVGHAADTEGSQMLYKYPELCDIDKAKDYVQEEEELYYIDSRDSRDTLVYIPMTESCRREINEISGGSIGYATHSTSEKGKRYHEYLVSRLVRVLELMKKAS